MDYRTMGNMMGGAATMGVQLDRQALMEREVALREEASARAKEEAARKLMADEGMANMQQFTGQALSQTGRDAVRGTVSELGARAQAGEISPEEHQTALKAIRSNYTPEAISSNTGAIMSRGYGAPAGMKAEQDMNTYARELLINNANKLIDAGDYQGLARWHADNNNYGDGNDYMFLGKDPKTGNLKFGRKGSEGAEMVQEIAPDMLKAHYASSIDPKHALAYAKIMQDKNATEASLAATNEYRDERNSISRAALGLRQGAAQAKAEKLSESDIKHISDGFAGLMTFTPKPKNALDDPKPVKNLQVESWVTNRLRGGMPAQDIETFLSRIYEQSGGDQAEYQRLFKKATTMKAPAAKKDAAPTPSTKPATAPPPAATTSVIDPAAVKAVQDAQAAAQAPAAAPAPAAAAPVDVKAQLDAKMAEWAAEMKSGQGVTPRARQLQSEINALKAQLQAAGGPSIMSALAPNVPSTSWNTVRPK